MNLDEIPRLIDAALKISKDGKIDILIHKYYFPPFCEQDRYGIG